MRVSALASLAFSSASSAAPRLADSALALALASAAVRWALARAAFISASAALASASDWSRRRRASPISPLMRSSRASMVPPTLGTNTLANRNTMMPKITSIHTI